ncbi:MAG: xylose isomerase [Firmicutes bacterium]|jgi:xylose isomerase|nr:xylose isomerase [Bacillota bacterium]MCL5064014.1 xylose isomerase [Bacillota bacterium]
MASQSDKFQPTKADHFTFGLWTVGNQGRDPFGDAVRAPLSPLVTVEQLSKLGAYGVTLHDNDLIPLGASDSEREKILRDFKKALSDYDLRVPMVTVNLFYHPVFKDGAFTSSMAPIRRYAIDKAKKAIDLGQELGAETFVLWGGREGSEVDAARDPRDAMKHYRQGVNELTEHILKNRYPMRIAMEAKPNEPRSDIYLATTGAMLAFIATLDHPEMVGVNPEIAHEKMAGLNPYHSIGQALEAGKLFHIDLNDQKPGRYDQDLRFASDDLKGSFYVVKMLEDGGYQGPRHFDAHPYRSENAEGVWDFARGCMRTYLVLKDKVHKFAQDAEIQGILSELKTWSEREDAFDRDAWGAVGYQYEKLDQLVVELLLGAR